MNRRVSIIAWASLSALGTEKDQIWESYTKGRSTIAWKSFGEFSAPVSALDHKIEKRFRELQQIKNYKNLDPSVLMAILCSRRAVDNSGWKDGEFGINIGSSRGATRLFEQYFEEFIESGRSQVNTLSSPTTTLGNISSWVGHDLQSKGPVISHSITCSTALHGILNGVAWINSGMSDRFLAGGSEASNTPFTVAQMKALKIYSDDKTDFPCRSLDSSKKRNSMVLGEAAAVFCLENENAENPLAYISGLGHATEPLKHNISISADALCFQKSMAMALENTEPNEVDVIVTHTPGTLRGDESEIIAIKKVFKGDLPALTCNKWLIGHTLGASGTMSMEMALLMMEKQEFIPIPFKGFEKRPEQIRKVMVNAVGFGGNAVSILLSLD